MSLAWPASLSRGGLDQIDPNRETTLHVQNGVLLAVSQRKALSDLDADNFDRVRDDMLDLGSVA
jgi:hypothetical protein